MANIKDVAKRAGVSIATVSHVINKTRFVSDETQKKVEDAMKELSYQRNIMGVNLRQQNSRTIGLVVPFIPEYEDSNQFYLWVMLGAEKVLTKYNYSLIMSNSEEKIEGEKAAINRLKQHQVEGIILAAPDVHKQHKVKQLNNIPFVFIDREPQGLSESYDIVMSDSKKAVYDAITEQIKRGKKHFGIINSGSKNLYNVQLRYQGFLQALKDNNIEFDPTYAVDEIPKEDLGYSLAKKLFETHPNIDSLLITMNDMGFGTLKYLKDSGRKIPEDLNITLFDDTLWNRASSPSITTIAQNPFKIGQIAAEAMINRLENPNYKPKKQLINTKLNIRESWD
ncbi:MAG: LacI family DNA-binding transcriptional regulator [Pleomorphochaeta sp.]